MKKTGIEFKNPEERSSKISKALTGKPISDEHKKKLMKGYIIHFFDGRVIEVYGLKQFAADNGFQYTYLNMMSRNGQSSSKYGIKEISLVA